MDRPIYTGNKRKNVRWRQIFIIVIIFQLVLLSLYLYNRSVKLDKKPTDNITDKVNADYLDDNLPLEAIVKEKSNKSFNKISEKELAPIKKLFETGNYDEAYNSILPLLSRGDENVINLLGQINMRRLLSSQPMQDKIFYVVKSGDYLQKIANEFNTTVALIKIMNGLQTDTIRTGSRLIVFNGKFTIKVSKTNNFLDLIHRDKLFKRYPVGTGKFGKTPAVEFFVYDKIIEPPWTRPEDNRHIEYGDPENVLGTRWMALRSINNPSLKGFGIHGTWERDSIGAQSSAGCVRMFNEDVEELFDIIPRKSRVIIEN